MNFLLKFFFFINKKKTKVKSVETEKSEINSIFEFCCDENKHESISILFTIYLKVIYNYY